MGRFDEWLADDASLMRKGTEHDSTQREETTTVEANEGSTTENGKVSTGPFSILEEHAATEADSRHDNWPDNAGDSVTEVIEPDIAPYRHRSLTENQTSSLKPDITDTKRSTTRSAPIGCSLLNQALTHSRRFISPG